MAGLSWQQARVQPSERHEAEAQRVAGAAVRGIALPAVTALHSDHALRDAQLPHATGGAPLPAALRAPMEAGLHLDLAAVRVHSDRQAMSLTRRLGARACTHGRDIYLGERTSITDVGLMAHELGHVAQQTASAARPAIQCDPLPATPETRVVAIAESLLFHASKHDLPQTHQWLATAKAEGVTAGQLRATFHRLHRRSLSSFLLEQFGRTEAALSAVSDLVASEVLDSGPARTDESPADLRERIESDHGIRIETPDRGAYEEVLRQRFARASESNKLFNQRPGAPPRSLFSPEAEAALASLPRIPTAEELQMIERAIVGLRARFGGARIPGVATIYLVPVNFTVAPATPASFTDLYNRTRDLLEVTTDTSGEGVTFRGEQAIEIAATAATTTQKSGGEFATFAGDRNTGTRNLTGRETMLRTTVHELAHAALQQAKDARRNPLGEQHADRRAAAFEAEWRTATGWLRDGDVWVLEVDSEGSKQRLDPTNWSTLKTADKPVSAYAASSPEEDMADAIAFYLINPRQVFYYSPIRARLCQKLTRQTRAQP